MKLPKLLAALFTMAVVGHTQANPAVANAAERMEDLLQRHFMSLTTENLPISSENKTEVQSFYQDHLRTRDRVCGVRGAPNTDYECRLQRDKKTHVIFTRYLSDLREAKRTNKPINSIPAFRTYAN